MGSIARFRRPPTLSVALMAVFLIAPVGRADAADCPKSQKSGCLAIPASKVTGSGSKTATKGVRLPYVIGRGGRRRPRKGKSVEIPAGRHDPEGFAGVVVATGRKGRRAAIFAVPPAPDIAAARKSARRAFDSVTAAAGGSLLELIPPKVVAQAARLMAAPECG